MLCGGIFSDSADKFVGCTVIRQVILCDVCGIQHGLCGQKCQGLHEFIILGGIKFHASCGLACLQRFLQLQENIQFSLQRFILLCELYGFGNAAFQNFDIGENQFQIDGFNITDGVDGAVHMDNVCVLKAADNMTDSIHLADMAEEFIAKALALGCTAYQTCNIDKFDYRGCCFCGIIHFCQPCQTFIGDGNHTHVGVDGAEGVIGCLCLAQCHRIK